MQAEVCWENILKIIEGEDTNAGQTMRLKEYESVKGMEGILKLSLGKVCFRATLTIVLSTWRRILIKDCVLLGRERHLRSGRFSCWWWISVSWEGD